MRSCRHPLRVTGEMLIPFGHTRLLRGALVVLAVVTAVRSVRAQSPSYAQLYDPLNVFNLHFEMDPADWTAIQTDTTLDLEKPAWFYADGESKMLVSVRRKSLVNTGDKFGLKVDVNEYFGENTWHGVKKLSLEADASDVISEGLAWYMHRKAAVLPGDNYQPGLASWVNVNVNGQTIGVYANVEQVDKRFLRNRDLWTSGQTWLYKNSDIGPPVLEEGPSATSPTKAALNYSPFTGTAAPPPGYEAQLESLIDMKGMLTLGAVNAFTTNEDELFTKGKNFWFADYASGERIYFPWDLDAVFKSTNHPIYGSNTAYQQRILNNPAFRAQYDQIMLDLLNGPMSVSELSGFLDDLEVELTPWLAADPNSDIDDPAARFDELRTWISGRHANVLGQVQADMALLESGAGLPEPSTTAVAGMFAIGMLKRRRAA
jgi:hypothetical protein